MYYRNIPVIRFQVVTACDEFDDNPDNKYSLKNIIDELEKWQPQNMLERYYLHTINAYTNALYIPLFFVGEDFYISDKKIHWCAEIKGNIFACPVRRPSDIRSITEASTP